MFVILPKPQILFFLEQFLFLGHSPSSCMCGRPECPPRGVGHRGPVESVRVKAEGADLLVCIFVERVAPGRVDETPYDAFMN